MREIKFRTWDKKEKKFWYFNPVDGLFTNRKEKDEYLKVIQQYTGLRDKNGKEIYEGDIIKYSMGGTMQKNPAIVDIKELYGLLGDYCDPYYATDKKDFEVIGNIYENPSLLKVQAKNL